jgi:UDP:flavonoid glycosyltransferase YjiC (YdhE family)
MRVLITSIPQVSHVFPIVPLAWSLRASGHEVLVAAQPGVDRAIISAGLPAATVGAPFDMIAFFRSRLPDGTMPVRAWDYDQEMMMAIAGRTWSNWARQVLGEQLALARAFRPDLIICDPMELSARIVGGVLGVPVAEHRFGLDAASSRFDEMAAQLLRPLAVKHGLAALPQPDLVLDPCPPSLQMPGGKAGVPIRYIPYNGSGAPPDRPAPSGRPRVCVSFGRVVASLTGGRLFHWTIEALQDIGDVGITLAVTPNDMEEIGLVPDEVDVRVDIPLNLLLPGHDVLVHHGGDGTGMTGLCHGIPQVVLPQIANQFPFGQRIQACGAGLTLADEASQTSVSAIGAAIRTVLTGPGCRTAAAGLGAEIGQMPAPPSLVPVLERLAAGDGR